MELVRMGDAKAAGSLVEQGASGASEPATVMALRVAAAQMIVTTNYDRLLKHALARKPPSKSSKLERSYQRVLRGTEAQQILTIVWKESPYVADSDLISSGLSRTFADGDLTVYRLAVALAGSAAEVAALNSRIRNISIAAAAYGLIDKVQSSTTKNRIRGTERLHELMVRLGDENAKAWQQALSSCVSIPLQTREDDTRRSALLKLHGSPELVHELA